MFARTLDEHRQAVETLLAPLVAGLDARPQLVNVHDSEAFDRVLVRPVVALVPVPTFDNSQMDGYAVFAEDLAGASPEKPVTLPIGVTTAAGDAPVEHVRGTASPVMTGAAIPVGADAVVPVENSVAFADSGTFADTVAFVDTVVGAAAGVYSNTGAGAGASLGIFKQEFPPLARAGEGEPAGEVTFIMPVEVGTFVRRRAEDLEVGATVLRAGTRLTPSRIGAAAAVGVAEVYVRPRPRVLLCTTGDEISGVHQIASDDESSSSGVLAGSGERSGSVDLQRHSASAISGEFADVDAGQGSAGIRGNGNLLDLRPGQICDANTPMLRAALHGLGVDVEILRSGDNPDEFREALLARVGECDLIITTGGISRGAYEVVRSALGPLGVEFGTVAIQPGGPQGMGSIPGVNFGTNAGANVGEGAGKSVDVSVGKRDAVLILCFPGNPVSAILSFELFLAPTLRELSGLPAERPEADLLLAHDVVSPEHKHQVRRGMIDADGNVVVFGAGSHLIGDLADADVLVHLPIAVTRAGAGSPVQTWRFND